MHLFAHAMHDIAASAAGLLTQIGSLPYAVRRHALFCPEHLEDDTAELESRHFQTTKHAIVAVAEWLRISYANKGISVACICPQVACFLFVLIFYNVVIACSCVIISGVV